MMILKLFLLLVTLMFSGHVMNAQEVDLDLQFFHACSGGHVDEVKAFLQDHPGTYHIIATSASFISSQHI